MYSLTIPNDSDRSVSFPLNRRNAVEKIEAVRHLAFANSLDDRTKVGGIQQILEAPANCVEETLKAVWQGYLAQREIPEPPAKKEILRPLGLPEELQDDK
ncbi:MAG: hypothetical protein NT026_02155 [Candidatus Staskawiczbacteria bacterium]|nr:hypothetical protein [Candidatus Staskawiczbacteria bacterium]